MYKKYFIYNNSYKNYKNVQKLNNIKEKMEDIISINEYLNNI